MMEEQQTVLLASIKTNFREICRSTKQYIIYWQRYRLHTGNRKEVFIMDLALSFIVAVAAGVVCHYIIKWLDGDK